MANYSFGADWNGQNGNVTTVGSAGLGSESFYGTSDQGGNVFEWDETPFLDFNNRGLRGGRFNFGEIPLRSSSQGVGKAVPRDEATFIGFRVASPVFCGADLDCDGDVDLIDFGLFQGQFTGPQ